MKRDQKEPKLDRGKQQELKQAGASMHDSVHATFALGLTWE